MDDEYRKLLTRVYDRDGWKCRHCNFRGNLHAHHVVYRSLGGEDALNNLITLCNSCHSGHHNGHLDILLLTTTDTDVLVRFFRKGNWKP